MMKFPFVRAKVDILGVGEISINGMELPVKEMTIRIGPPGRATEVSLVLNCTVDIDLESTLADIQKEN